MDAAGAATTPSTAAADVSGRVFLASERDGGSDSRGKQNPRRSRARLLMAMPSIMSR